MTKIKPVKAWAVVRNGLIVPSVRMRLFVLRLEAEEFIKRNYLDNEEADLQQVLITPITKK